MSTEQPPAEHRPAEAGRPVARWVVVGIGAVVAVTGLVATFLPRSRPDISYRVLAVHLDRADRVTVTFEVDKPPLATAVCAVSAFNDEAGERHRSWRLTGIEVGPTPGRRVARRTVVVPTSEQASSAAMAGCTITRDH